MARPQYNKIKKMAEELYKINVPTTSAMVKEVEGRKKVINQPPWRDITIANCRQRFVAANILAILTGSVSGLTVIDIDCKKADEKAEDGMTKWAQLIEQHGEPITWKAKTGNGGLHYYFKYDESIKQTTKVKFDGVEYTIDIRNDGGMIYAPPSSYKSKKSIKRYSWERSPFETPLAPIPDFLKAALVRPNIGSNIIQTYSQVAYNNDFINQLLSLLDTDKARRYERWYDLGAILFNVFNGSSDGYKRWTEYLQNNIPASCYDEPECRRTWERYQLERSEAKKKTIRSLYFYAKEENPKKFDQLMKDQLNNLVRGRINDPDHAIYYDDLVEIKFVHECDKKQFMVDTIAFINNNGNSFYYVKSLEDYGIQFVEVTESHLKNNLKGHGIPVKYLNDIKPLITYKKHGFYPYSGKSPPNGQKYIFNYFNGFRVHQLNETNGAFEDVERILHHIKCVYCKDDENVYDYLIRWFAHIVQKPNTITGVCLYFYSEPGAGKSLFLNWFCKSIIGKKYIEANCNLDKVFGKFNSTIKDKIMIICNEIKDKDTYKYTDSIKRLITEPDFMIEQKGKDACTITNHSNWIFCSNNKYTMNLGLNDRRMFCLDLSNRYVGNHDYFDDLIRSLNDSSAVAFYNFLMKINISNWVIQKIPLAGSYK